jgi:hypothetical protein
MCSPSSLDLKLPSRRSSSPIMAAKEWKLKFGSGGGVSVSTSASSPSLEVGRAESSRSVREDAPDDVLVPAAGDVVGTARGRGVVTGEEDMGCGRGCPVRFAREDSRCRAPALSRISVFSVEVGSVRGL